MTTRDKHQAAVGIHTDLAHYVVAQLFEIVASCLRRARDFTGFDQQGSRAYFFLNYRGPCSREWPSNSLTVLRGYSQFRLPGLVLWDSPDRIRDELGFLHFSHVVAAWPAPGMNHPRVNVRPPVGPGCPAAEALYSVSRWPGEKSSGGHLAGLLRNRVRGECR